MTQHKQSHRIKWRDHYIKWHDMTWHATTPRHLTTNHITASHPASNFMTSKQVTLPPWNSRKLVRSKEMVWAWRWSVALRTFYRQILSLLYSSFFFWNFRPRLARELLVYLYIHTHSTYLHSVRWIFALLVEMICVCPCYCFLSLPFVQACNS